jgi:membrane-associated phospholipid phosphatase
MGISFDQWLLYRINQRWASPFWDGLAPLLRQSTVGIPLYLFLITFAIFHFRRKGWIWCFALGMTVVVSDLACGYLLKSLLLREPPCSASFGLPVRQVLEYCPTGSSFPSAAAGNLTAWALFSFYTLKKTSRWWALLFLWPLVVAYAQIYLGLAYPLDVLAGFSLGGSIGYGISLFFRGQYGSLFPKTS